MMELHGRVALVTGGGRRVGRAIALGLGTAGMRVAVHYNASAEGAEATARELNESGRDAAAFGTDLTDVNAIAPLVDAVTTRFGELALLVNSAAVMVRTPLGEVTVDDWDDMFALNLRAPFFLAQAAAPALRAARGAIVNIADLAAFETWPAYVPHSITKAGVVSLTKSLARVLAPDVRVNAVAPGAVLLPDEWNGDDRDHLAATTPLRRIGTPEDVVQAVEFLARADYITGETLIVDGGRHVRT